MRNMQQPAIERNAGHIQTSYCWLEGALYRRTFDQADRSEKWHRADDASAARLAQESYSPGGAVHGPDVERWIPCAEPTS